MRYFLDCEFNEDPQQIMLISLALRAQDGRELYLVSSDFSRALCNQWVLDNVIPRLDDPRPDFIGTRPSLAERVDAFVTGPHPEFWGYYADYDWFLFCRLWGGMLRIPERFPKVCMDLKQLQKTLLPDVDLKSFVPQDKLAHNALGDVRWNARVYDWIVGRAIAQEAADDHHSLDLRRGVDVALSRLAIDVPESAVRR